MLTVGRYKIAFGRVCWLQTHKPVVARRFLCFIWVFKEARPGDIDKKQQFPPGTPMVHEGRRYYYYKAGKDIHVGNGVEDK